MHQNLQLYHNFAHCRIQCEEKAKSFLDGMESNAFFVHEIFVVLCQKFNGDFRRFVKKFERTITKLFRFVRKLNS